MEPANACPRCGSARLANAPAGLCPRCLLVHGLRIGASINVAINEVPRGNSILVAAYRTRSA